jgi:hypothetical protein
MSTVLYGAVIDPLAASQTGVDASPDAIRLPAWGRRVARTVATSAAYRSDGVKAQAHAVRRAASSAVRGVARIPVDASHAAFDTDPSHHAPQRFCGSALLSPPYHDRYGYYKRYGAAGYAADTSPLHFTPLGAAPSPTRLFS